MHSSDRKQALVGFLVFVVMVILALGTGALDNDVELTGLPNQEQSR